MTKKKITLEQLKNLKACSYALKNFETLFGQEVTRTEELVLKHYMDFDIDWAASWLLPSESRAKYVKVHDAARAEYYKVRGAAWAEYVKVRGGPAWAKYEKVCAAARAEYDKVHALAFCRLFVHKGCRMMAEETIAVVLEAKAVKECQFPVIKE